MSFLKERQIFVYDKDVIKDISQCILSKIPFMRRLLGLSTKNSCVGKLVLLFLIDIMNYIAYQIFPLLTSSRKAQSQIGNTKYCL